VSRQCSLLSTGTPGQQKRALSLLFSRIDADLHGKATVAERQSEIALCFRASIRQESRPEWIRQTRIQYTWAS
jgi:hypothetical protein